MTEPRERLSQPTAAALAEVRWLLDDARSRATSAIAPARRSAVIALDGAIESAVWLVARNLGEAPSRRNERFDQLLEAARTGLEGRGIDWSEPGLAGVLQLRQARNGAQHAAVRPDPDQLAEWTDAAVAFVDGLLDAAFGVTTEHVGLALAIGDGPLREALGCAEAALRDGDTSRAFASAWDTFEDAVARWTASPASGGRLIPPQAYFPTPDAELRMQVHALSTFQDIQTFAPDLGEYRALQRVRDLLDSPAFVPSDEDARRAIRFATTWIARWEAFERGYPDERWHSALDELEPPRDDSAAGPVVVNVDASPAEMGSGNARWVVDAQIANVPERARGDWGHDLPQCLTDAIHEGGAAIRLTGVSPLGYDGRVRVMIEPGADGAQVRAMLDAAVRFADERYHERIDRSAEYATEERVRFDAWRSAIHDGSGGALDVSQVSREVRGDGDHYMLNVFVTSDVPDVVVCTSGPSSAIPAECSRGLALSEEDWRWKRRGCPPMRWLMSARRRRAPPSGSVTKKPTANGAQRVSLLSRANSEAESGCCPRGMELPPR